VAWSGRVTKQYDGFNTVANLTTVNYNITGFIAGEGATIGWRAARTAPARTLAARRWR